MKPESLTEEVKREVQRVVAAFEVKEWKVTIEPPSGFAMKPDSLLFAGCNEAGDKITWQVTTEGDTQSVQINGHWVIWRSQEFRHKIGRAHV